MRIAALAAVALVASISAPADGSPARRAPDAKGSCAEALLRGAVCQAAVAQAGRLFKARDLSGAIVIQDVRTGAVATYGAFDRGPEGGHGSPGPTGIDTSILPLSAAKLFIAAAAWREAEASGRRLSPAQEKDLHEMLVWGSDSLGRSQALDLRRWAGNAAASADFARFGAPPCPPWRLASPQRADWDPGPTTAPAPARACTTLSSATPDAEWAEALSVGETHFSTTLLHLSRFLQAVGDGGVMLTPSLRETPDGGRAPVRGARVFSQTTAAKLQSAMLDAVRRGSAMGVKDRLRGGWRLGGKTGTGPAQAQPHDGCFVGLAFDPKGAPRYTVAIYVRHGGKGGGAAAEIAADVINAMLGLQGWARIASLAARQNAPPPSWARGFPFAPLRGDRGQGLVSAAHPVPRPVK
jgi:hypothetical protein